MPEAGSLVLLKAFLIRFAPKVNHKRKYSHNEFSFAHKTVSKIFLQQNKIEISAFDFAKVLAELDYTFYIRDGESGLRKSEIKRNIKKSKSKIPFFDLDDDIYIYLNISSKTIWELKVASQSISYLKNPEKIVRISLLKQKISLFFKTMPLF